MKKLFLLLLAFSCNSAFSQAAQADGSFQKAIGGIIQEVAVQRGFSITDPRTYGTLYGAGKVAVAGAAVVGAGALVAGTSPAWGTILAVAAVGGAVSYGISIGIEKTVTWAFGSSPTTVHVIQPGGVGSLPVFDSSNIYLQDASGWHYMPRSEYPAGGWMSCPDGPYCSTGAEAEGVRYVLKNCGSDATTMWCGIYKVGGPYGADGVAQSNGQTFYTKPVFTDYHFPAPSPVASTKSLTDAFSSVPAATLAQPVDYQAMALIINDLWKKAAAQEGYAGLPYQLEKPVTATEVEKWAVANPYVYPKVQQLVDPVLSPATGFVPSTTTAPGSSVTPATSASPSNVTNPNATQPKIDLGGDPNIGAPALESPDWLEPLLNMLPGWRTASFTAQGQCWKPSFDFRPVIPKVVEMHSHCDLLEQNRELLSVVMSAVWVMVAAFIILRA